MNTMRSNEVIYNTLIILCTCGLCGGNYWCKKKFRKVYAADFSLPVTKFYSHLLAEPGSCMRQKVARLCCRVGAPMWQFCLVYGADFGSTVSTGAFMLLINKIPRLCIFEHTVPLCALKKWSAS